MKSNPLVSIVINNYNYGRFLPEAIESALGQTYENTEVIVVDDGSTDHSRQIVAGYGDRLGRVFKSNGGQASAFNAGFAASRGDIVVFLDADDVLLPEAAQRIATAFDEGEPAKVHWRLWAVDAERRRSGRMWPEKELPAGDLRAAVLREGPESITSPPTSGNAWSRRFLEAVLPMPEADYRLCADEYLCVLAPVFGPVSRLDEPQGLYRIHGGNHHQSKSFEERLQFGLRVQSRQATLVSCFLRRMGYEADADRWYQRSWFPRVQRATRELLEQVPAGDAFLLADENQWGMDEWFSGRRRIPFPSHEGCYWGPPATDEAAIEELEHQRQLGAAYLVVAWPAFWWLEHYSRFRRHLDGEAHLLLEGDDLRVFRLGTPPTREEART